MCNLNQKTITSIKSILILVLLLFFTFSCDDDLANSTTQIDFSKDEHFVPLETIQKIATEVQFVFSNDSELKKITNTSNALKSKEISKILEAPDDKGVTAFYIVNYKEQGFVIIAADDRIEPILGFSDSGNFSTQEQVYPSGG